MRRIHRSPLRVLVDTAAFAALARRSDGNHIAARSIQAQLQSEHWQLLTTNFLLAETHAFLLGRGGQRLALRTVQDIQRGPTRIERVTVEDEERALEILVQYDDKDFSYTDATSFAVMERLGIDTAFTFDRHSSQYGFRTLTADQT